MKFRPLCFNYHLDAIAATTAIEGKIRSEHNDHSTIWILPCTSTEEEQEGSDDEATVQDEEQGSNDDYDDDHEDIHDSSNVEAPHCHDGVLESTDVVCPTLAIIDESTDDSIAEAEMAPRHSTGPNTTALDEETMLMEIDSHQHTIDDEGDTKLAIEFNNPSHGSEISTERNDCHDKQALSTFVWSHSTTLASRISDFIPAMMTAAVIPVNISLSRVEHCSQVFHMDDTFSRASVSTATLSHFCNPFDNATSRCEFSNMSQHSPTRFMKKSNIPIGNNQVLCEQSLVSCCAPRITSTPTYRDVNAEIQQAFCLGLIIGALGVGKQHQQEQADVGRARFVHRIETVQEPQDKRHSQSQLHGDEDQHKEESPQVASKLTLTPNHGSVETTVPAAACCLSSYPQDEKLSSYVPEDSHDNTNPNDASFPPAEDNRTKLHPVLSRFRAIASSKSRSLPDLPVVPTGDILHEPRPSAGESRGHKKDRRRKRESRKRKTSKSSREDGCISTAEDQSCVDATEPTRKLESPRQENASTKEKLRGENPPILTQHDIPLAQSNDVPEYTMETNSLTPTVTGNKLFRVVETTRLTENSGKFEVNLDSQVDQTKNESASAPQSRSRMFPWVTITAGAKSPPSQLDRNPNRKEVGSSRTTEICGIPVAGIAKMGQSFRLGFQDSDNKIEGAKQPGQATFNPILQSEMLSSQMFSSAIPEHFRIESPPPVIRQSQVQGAERPALCNTSDTVAEFVSEVSSDHRRDATKQVAGANDKKDKKRKKKKTREERTKRRKVSPLEASKVAADVDNQEFAVTAGHMKNFQLPAGAKRLGNQVRKLDADDAMPTATARQFSDMAQKSTKEERNSRQVNRALPDNSSNPQHPNNTSLQAQTGTSNERLQRESCKTLDFRDPLVAIDHTRPTVAFSGFTDLTPFKVFCSESFLETCSEVVAELASGRWTSSLLPNDDPSSQACQAVHLGRKMEFYDSLLVDKCGVDIELCGRRGIIVSNLVSWQAGTEGRQLIRRLVQLASIGRYKSLNIILCTGIAINGALAAEVNRLQNAVLRHGDNPTTSFYVRITSPSSLSATIAHCAFDSIGSHYDKISGLYDVVRDVAAVERLRFLLGLVPALTAGGAIQMLVQCSPGRSLQSLVQCSGQAFHRLLTSASFGSERMSFEHSNEIHPAAVQQLSHVLNVFIGKLT